MTKTHIQPPVLPCMCGNLRRAARSLTQLYEEALRPLGLRSTQFTLLQVLALAGEVTQRQLGEILAMDSTTLTRTLAIVRRSGWVAERKGKDRRERLLRLAPQGRRLFERSVPVWRKTQARLARELGESRWRELSKLSLGITRIAKGAQS